MNQTLSVVLPVYNAQATLSRQVAELLDVLTDWQNRFEILIVDDGSTDHTEECARDLAREYPQLRVVRQQRREGRLSAIRTGKRQSRGQVVYVHGEDELSWRGATT